MEAVHVNLIGGGRHAQACIWPALRLAGAVVDSVTARSEASARALAAAAGAPRAWADVGAMLAHEDAAKVVAVLPGSAADAVVCRCLAAGKEVFTEKPCGMSAAAAAAVQDAAARAGRGVQVGFMKRYAPVYTELAALIAGGELGDLHSLSARFAVDASAFCATDRDYLYYVGIHMIDLVQWLCGPLQLLCAAKDARGSGCTYLVTLRAAQGALVALELQNRSAWTREREELTLTFTDGFAATRDTGHLAVHRAAAAPAPWQTLAEEDRVFSASESPASGTARDLYLRGFVGEMAAFLARPVPVTDDNLRLTLLCEEILAALAR